MCAALSDLKRPLFFMSSEVRIAEEWEAVHVDGGVSAKQFFFSFFSSLLPLCFLDFFAWFPLCYKECYFFFQAQFQFLYFQSFVKQKIKTNFCKLSANATLGKISVSQMMAFTNARNVVALAESANIPEKLTAVHSSSRTILG